MEFKDWEWLMESGKAANIGALSERVDLERLRRLAPECSLSNCDIDAILAAKGELGVLSELHSRVVTGRKQLQDAIVMLTSESTSARASAIAALRLIASSDPYAVNREVAQRTLDSFEAPDRG